MDVCEARPSVHFYAVDVQGNTYSNGSKKATAVSTYQPPPASHPGPYRPASYPSAVQRPAQRTPGQRMTVVGRADGGSCAVVLCCAGLPSIS